jgi:3-dehydroquinate dehydratase
MEDEMSMLSLQTDQLRELAYEVQEGEEVSERELIDALHEAAETIEDLILKNEALPKVIATYPDGTIVVRVEDVEKVSRVMLDTGHYCKMIYGDE